MPLIEYGNVRKVFGSDKDSSQVVALDNVSFNVDEGEVVVLVGPSGCGKTTLLRITGGLMKATSGVVKVGGEEVTEPKPNMGFVFQSPVLAPWERVLGNVLLPIKLAGGDPKGYTDKAHELIETVGLKGFETRYPFELSGGMQQRVAMARALIRDPAVLLMDEPFGALDALTRHTMNVELLRIWAEKKRTILLVTHDIAEAVFLAQRVVVMTPRPGKVTEIVNVDLPMPRTAEVRYTSQFNTYAERIHKMIFDYRRET